MKIPGNSYCREDVTLEVKSGEPVKVEIAKGQVAYLLKAKLEKNCEENDKICSLYLTVDGKRIGVGSLHPVTRPEHDFKLLLDRGFQFSHTLSNGIVVLSLSKVIEDRKVDQSLFDDDDEEEEGGKEEEGYSSKKRKREECGKEVEGSRSSPCPLTGAPTSKGKAPP